MKANRKFVQADDAVSPVIAVILMVAITVVLAATVFVLVSDIGGNTGSAAPTISWNPDETQDRLIVNTAAQNADWFRLTVQADSCTSTGAIYAGDVATTYILRNVAADDDAATISTGANCASPAAVRVGVGAGRIQAGDYVDFCSITAIATNVKITVKDTTANALVTSHTFTDVGIC